VTHTLRIKIAAGETLAAEFASDVRALAGASLAENEIFALALPGGSAADVLLPALARVPLPWDRVHIFWCDERDVSENDPASNAGQLRRLWLGSAALASAKLHPMAGGAADVVAAAARYELELDAVLGRPPQMDLVLLGVGEDGHVASLFPGHDALRATERTVLPVMDSPKPPARRVTLTLPVLAAARRVAVAAFGTAKAVAIRDALRDPAAQTPLALLLRQAGDVMLLLDDGAASLLDADRPPPSNWYTPRAT
jgi:6-phosphogluconolactonase